MPDEPQSVPRAAVATPTGRDSALLCDFLQEEGILCTQYRSVAELASGLSDDLSFIIIADEAFEAGDGTAALTEKLLAQPAWSDIPVILLLGGDIAYRSARRFAARRRKVGRSMMFVQRPVRKATLKSVVASALRDRLRQYEIREYLSEQKRNEEQLRYTQKLESIGMLASGVAHDFNNLLTGMLGNASLALEDVPEGHPAHIHIEEISTAGSRAVDLTRQLLNYSGKGQFMVRPLDLSGLVNETSRLVHLAIPKQIQLRLELAPDAPIIEGDSSQIQQIVMNLIINGAEAIGQDQEGVVTVRTGWQQVQQEDLQQNLAPNIASPGRYVCLEVKDTGSGMDDATRARIFDPFFTTKTTGRGLGLSAVLGIVRSHHGVLRLQTAPQHGSTFTVLFPVSEKRGEARESPAGTVRQVEGGEVLVVDDEEIVRKLAKVALERAGYSVLLASNGEEAIQRYRESGGTAIVLLDMTMPGLSAQQVVQSLRKVNPRVPVILSSGYNESDAMQRFGDADLAGFLQKPYTAAALTEKVGSVSANPPKP